MYITDAYTLFFFRALKRRHGLRRCRYRGASGMQRWVGLGVLANDRLVLAGAGP